MDAQLHAQLHAHAQAQQYAHHHRAPCPDCGAPHHTIKDVHGSLTCTNCGLVLCDRLIDFQPEWRVFDEGDEDKCRATFTRESAVSTIKAASMRDTFHTIKTKLDLPDCIISLGVELYNTHVLSVKAMVKGEDNRLAMAAACVLYASRDAPAGSGHRLTDLAMRLCIPESKITKACNVIRGGIAAGACGGSSIARSIAHTGHGIDKLIARMVNNTVCIPRECMWPIQKLCIKLYAKVKGDAQIQRQIPEKVVGALIHMACLAKKSEMATDISMATIASYTNTSVATMIKIEKHIGRVINININI